MQDAPKALKRIFSHPKNLPFLKESLLSVGVRSISALSVGKIIALNFGPAGTALFGQLINLYSGFSITGSDGLGRAAVKEGVAFDTHQDQNGINRTVGTASVLLGLLFIIQWVILLSIYLASGWSVQKYEGIQSVWIWGLFSLITVGYFSGYLFLIRKQTQWQAFSTTTMSLGGLAGLGLATWFHFNLQNSLLSLFGCQAFAGFLAFGLKKSKLQIRLSQLGVERKL